MRTAIRKLLLAVLAWPSLAIAAEPLLFHEHGFGLSFTPDGTVLLAPSHEGLAASRSPSAPSIRAATPRRGLPPARRPACSAARTTEGRGQRSRSQARRTSIRSPQGMRPVRSMSSTPARIPPWVPQDCTSPRTRAARGGAKPRAGSRARSTGSPPILAMHTPLRRQPRRASTSRATPARFFRRLGRRTPVGALTFASDGRLLSARVPLDYLPPPAVVW